MPPSTPTIVDFLRASDRRASVACGGGKLFHEACDSSPRGFSSCGAACGQPAGQPASVSPSAAPAAATPDSRDDGLSNDQHKVNDTITMLRAYAHNGSRFFLGIGLSATHVMRPAGLCSYRAAKAAGLDASAAALAAIELPPRRSSERRPPLVTWPNYDLKAGAAKAGAPMGGPRKRGMSPSESRLAIGSYFACATHVDTQVGRLLDALGALRLEANTAVVVHSDHGFSLGRHGRWSKYSLYEEAVRVPLVIAVPGMHHGAVVDDIVESVDILPTLLDLWGARRGAYVSDGSEEPTASYSLGQRAVRLDGHSLLPFLEEGARGINQQQQPLQHQQHQQQHQPPASPPPPRAISIGTAWPKWYARSELHETFRRNSFDGPVAGGGAADVLWPGAQLWIRTARFAYTAYFELSPSNQTLGGGGAGEGSADGASVFALGSFRLVDETLYDTGGADAEETNNIAYDVAHQAQRARLLDLCLRDWSVRLKGPRDATRAQRIAYLKTATAASAGKTPRSA